jgi:hypothetical protein
MNEQSKILRAFRPGDLVFIEIPAALTNEAYQRYSEHLRSALDRTGVRAVILTEGIRVTAAEERSEAPAEPHVIKQISREMADYITGAISDYRQALTL